MEKMGFLPIYVLWNYNERGHRESLAKGIATYAVEQPFFIDTEECFSLCIPFPLGVSFFPFDQGISILRSCGTPEETINVLCTETSPVKWRDYFNKK